jgi:hypothetical protein
LLKNDLKALTLFAFEIKINGKIVGGVYGYRTFVGTE